jgi:hypothetical protein
MKCDHFIDHRRRPEVCSKRLALAVSPATRFHAAAVTLSVIASMMFVICPSRPARRSSPSGASALHDTRQRNRRSIGRASNRRLISSGARCSRSMTRMASRVRPDPPQCLFAETAMKSVSLIEGRNDFRDLTPSEIAGFTNCPRHGNIVYVDDLGMRTEKQMMVTPNFGRRSRDQDAAGRDRAASWEERPGLASGQHRRDGLPLRRCVWTGWEIGQDNDAYNRDRARRLDARGVHHAVAGFRRETVVRTL